MIYKTKWQKAIERNTKWHDWFAWYPVRIEDRTAWLQTVRRRWSFIPGMMGHATEYRLKK